VSACTGELLKGGNRVRLPAQPFAILLLLLKTPGELVTREQLREQIWTEGTFVDFEHGLNAAMNKLRRALGDSAENPRYIETMPGRGYRFIGTLDSEDVVPISVVTKAEPCEQRSPRWRSVPLWERVSWAAGALLCLAIGLSFRSEPPDAPEWTLTRITSDPGLSAYPALSPDGKLVVYSSDRGLNGEQDLYVRQVAGGAAVRLTFDGAGNSAPDFSPDGSRIVFQSNRNGGGIYEIPALGGEPRLVARGGLNPKYSPDGSQVAYWVGAAAIHSAVPGSGAVWVVPTAGGAPRRIGTQFSAARQPIWLPDGKHVLFVGYTSTRAYENSAIDWWTAGTDGGDAVRTGVYKALVRTGLQLEGSPAKSALRRIPAPGCWSATTNTVVFSTGTGDQKDLWQIGVSPRTGEVRGALRRLTTSTLSESYPSCTAAGALALTSVETKTDVWSLPFDLDRGTARGMLQRVTTGPSLREYASLANNGGLLAFASNQSGQMNIWLRALASGAES